MPKIPGGAMLRDLTVSAAALAAGTLAARQAPRVASAARTAWDRLTAIRFGPGQPLPAQASADEQARGPRGYQYPVGINRTSTPRRDFGLLPFEQLRALATNYDVAALAIGARIEQLQGMPLTFVAKDKRQQARLQEQCEAAEAFWAKPDQQNDWLTWLSMLLYETFSIDAPTIYVRPDRAGRLYGLDVIDGATIKPVLGDLGQVVGYNQVLYGITETTYNRDGADADDERLPDYSAQELIYKPRWPRRYTPYGHPPTEWIILRVNMALRKQAFDLAYFTDGNIPEAFLTPIEKMNPQQVNEFEEVFNAYLQGDDQARRRIKFLPWEAKVHEFRQFSYETQLDRWLLGLTCAAYGISPQELGFVEDVNRANGEQQENINDRRGLRPLKRWLKSIIDPITQRGADQLGLGFAGIEAQFVGDEKEDQLSQAQTDKLYFDMGALSSDEIRTLRYSDALDGAAPGVPMLVQPGQPAPGQVQAIQSQRALPMPAPMLPAPRPITKAAKGDAEGNSDNDPEPPYQWDGRDAAEQDAEQLLRDAYAEQQAAIEAALREEQAVAPATWMELQQAFTRAVLPLFDQTALRGAEAGADRLSVGINWTGVNAAVLRYARERAASFAADETAATQKMVDQIVADWITDGGDLNDLVQRVARVWPDSRARAAAVTTVTTMFSEGQVLSWAESGVVKGYCVNTANDSRVCPKCNLKAFVDGVPGGVRIVYALDDRSGRPAFHWSCRCDVDPVVKEPHEL